MTQQPPDGGAPRQARDDGQSLVESALTFSALLLLLLGLVDFATIFRAYIATTSAANVGAGYGASSAGYDAARIATEARSELDGSQCSATTVSSAAPASDGLGGNRLSVTVTCQVAHLLMIPNVLDHLSVSATAVRRVRQ